MANNTEIVRRFWDELSVRRDFDAAAALVHPDAELDWSASRAPYAGVYRGEAEGRRLWDTVSEAWDVWDPEIKEAIEVDSETVITVTVMEGKGRVSGVTVRAGGASMWRIRDGKIVYAKLFQSKDEALSAVKLQAN